MQKLILTLLFSIGVFFSAYADEERTLPQMQYGLSGQYLPAQCGLSTDINIYVQAMNFKVHTVSAARVGAKPNGEPAYFVSTFINEDQTEHLVVVTSPSGDESCIVAHSFDLSINVPKTGL